jgi:hypothetical protein
MVKWLSCLLILFFVAVGAAHSSNLLSEGFDDITTLAGAGWVQTNNSSPVGSTGWFQGNPGVFAAQSGADEAYVAANFNNADFGGNISNWLLTPVLTLNNGDSISFYTRTDAAAFLDGLEVRLSTNGTSSDVGATDTSWGDFGTLLLTIDTPPKGSGYPEDWTPFTVMLSGLSGAVSGRFGFRYFVTDTSVNGDYIGIDTVSVNTASVPEPSTLLLLGTGIISLAGLRRRIAVRK